METLLLGDALPLLFRHQAVQRVDNFFQRVNVPIVDSKGIFGERLSLVEIVGSLKRGSVARSEFRQTSEDCVRFHWRLFAQGDQGVAEQSKCAGRSPFQDRGVFQLILSGSKDMLAKAYEQETQIALDLDAMEVHRNIKIGDGIRTKQDAMGALDVQAFDRENVGGTLEFFGEEEKRGRFLFFDSPPLDDGSKELKFVDVDDDKGAKNVEVGSAWPERATGAGAIENDGFEILTGGFLEPADQFA